MAVANENIYRELKRMNANLEILVAIYKKVIDSLIPEDSPTKEELEAILSKEELVGKEELLKALEE
ncbi:MAG: hypothetical protein ABH874_03350 [Methanobacteriota archaeon]|nr:hypothetical protein [Candidatus Hydrothermarchaeota archaeon]